MFVSLLALLLPFGAASPVKREYALDIFAERDGKCLVPGPGTPGPGTPVVSGRCDTIYSWDISYGSGAVVLSGQNLCLDAGSSPGNNQGLKLWTCYPGLYQQTWYYTDDHRIAITGGDQCLDEGTNGLQTYRCTPNNGNQVFFATSNRGFTLQPPQATSTVGPTSTTPPPPMSTSVRPDIPSGVVVPYPASGQGRQIRPFGRPDLCLTVQNGYAAIGSSVGISYCFDLSSAFISDQLWDYPGVYVTGPVKLHGTNYCLDFGSTPANGIDAKIWTCYPGLYQQTFYYTSDNIALAGTVDAPNPQCLDVRRGSQPGNQKPYNSLEEVQSWACDFSNPQQQWPKFI